MNNFRSIQDKLEQFIKKYYTNALIKGIILFFTIGLLYFLVTLFIEYTLWLNPTARTILFWVFISVELALFIRFIAIPLAQLLKLQKGIDYKVASKIIGSYFPEVSDKLLNVLQLNEVPLQSELLLASIEQKSLELNPIPFKLAINFRKNTKYLKYAAIPITVILLSYVSGKFNWFSDSYERVVNYQTAYEPPAPFQFFVINDSLQTLENKDFTLVFNTVGDVIPENVQINYNNETYYLKQRGPGVFEYVFTQPKSTIKFNVFANNVSSKMYELDVIKVPTLLSFDMVLDYPSYTNRRDEILKSTGNAIVPQGTKVSWNLKTKSTEKVTLNTMDSIFDFRENNEEFMLSRQLYKSVDYSLNTSNSNLSNYESLSFSIDVIRDEFPELNVKMEQDSLDSEILYFYGQVSDDYGLTKLQLVYYPSTDEDQKQKETISISNSNFDEFVNVFPSQITLEEGISYDLYFEVFDNDRIHQYKSSKSKVFTYRKLTINEVEEKLLNQQSETIDDLNKSLEKLEERDKELEEFSRTQKEKAELNFNDKKKLENFLNRQKQQGEMMQNFNKKLKENLENFQKENNENDQFKESLKQRLDENQEQLEKDEKLLDEIEKISEKIQKEELSKKLEELAKQNKNKKRSLEQLLELTKRYYVTMKSEKLRVELEEMAKEQEKLSEATEEENTKEKQDELNKEFEEFQEELKELREENQELQKPIELPKDVKKEEDIKKEQQEASEKLEKKEQSSDPQTQQENESDAKKKQKKAAQKMRQLSAEMSQSMMGGGGGEQMSEDIDMLRQILDNLLLFSFDQEAVMKQFRSIQINDNNYAKYLKKQRSLKIHFEHVDDSLFALSLRQPMLSEQINKEITEVFFNMDKSLEQLAENRLYQGLSAQRYTVTSANTLASLLSDILDNMENQMNPSLGKGGEGDMQLPDIIMSQEELNKQMEEGLKKQENGKKKDGNEGEKEGEKEGENGNKEGGEKDGSGEGDNEELNGELFEIYQRQQQLRQALEDRLGKKPGEGAGGDLLKKMEAVERDLLNRGFTNRTLQRMMELKHQLLKLENATFQQGEDQKRKSTTNLDQFAIPSTEQLLNAKQYFNTTEILNRQALPLQEVYKKKVQKYFKKTNDKF